MIYICIFFYILYHLHSWSRVKPMLTLKRSSPCACVFLRSSPTDLRWWRSPSCHQISLCPGSGNVWAGRLLLVSFNFSKSDSSKENVPETTRGGNLQMRMLTRVWLDIRTNKKTKCAGSPKQEEVYLSVLHVYLLYNKTGTEYMKFAFYIQITYILKNSIVKTSDNSEEHINTWKYSFVNLKWPHKLYIKYTFMNLMFQFSLKY